MNPKVLSLMGFSARARKILSGANQVSFSMERRKGKLLMLATDLAENSKEKMIAIATRQNIPYVVYGTMDEMSHITGEVGKGIFLITDKGFATSILKEINEDNK